MLGTGGVSSLLLTCVDCVLPGQAYLIPFSIETLV